MRVLVLCGSAVVVGACGTEAVHTERPVIPLYVDVSPLDGQETVEQPILSDEEVAAVFEEEEVRLKSLGFADPSREEDNDGIELPRREDLEICSQLTGMPVDHIVRGGSETRLSLDRETVLALRVVDSRARVALNLSTVNKAELAGLCLFMGGNQPQLDLRIAVPLDMLVLHATGSEAQGNIALTRGTRVRDWAVRLARSDARLTLTNTSECPRSSGSGASVVCQ